MLFTGVLWLSADKQQLLLQEETGCKHHRWVETRALAVGGREKKRKKKSAAHRQTEQQSQHGPLSLLIPDGASLAGGTGSEVLTHTFTKKERMGCVH